jgi:hypothetical protein
VHLNYQPAGGRLVLTLGRLTKLLRKIPVAPNLRSIHWCRPLNATFTMAAILRRAARMDSALGHSGPEAAMAVCEKSLQAMSVA